VIGWRLPSLWIRVPITLLACTGVLASYRGFSGVEAGSALLLMMAGMKLLETRNERDRAVVVLIGYFLLFAVFLREQAIWSAGWLVLGASGITASLAQTVRRETPLSAAGGLALATRMVLQALPLAALLFVLFPRIPGPFWAVPNAKLSGISGLSERIEPGDLSELSLSDEVAFRVLFEGSVPQAEELYWRGTVLERYDGRAWSVRPVPRQRRAPLPAPTGPAYEYQVFLEPHGQHWLLALETPVSWSAPRAALGSGLQLLNAEPVWDRLSYRALSITAAATAVQAGAEEQQVNLGLPAGRNPRAIQLARELRETSADDADFLARILQLFREQPFFYSLTPPPLGAEPVDEFLFATREGFCEHYASAFAMLARAGGVPARVVIGYQGGERNPFSNYWIVRQADAHAWVEVWLGNAWRRVDPTAAVAPERIERGFEAAMGESPLVAERLWRSSFMVNRLVLSWDAVNAAWNRWVLAFGPEMQHDFLLALGFEVPRPMQLALLACASMLAAMLILWLTLRHRSGPPDDAAARLYAQLCRRLARVVRARRPAEAPLHYAETVARARPELAADVRCMTDLYLRLRYGGAGDSALERELATLVRRFRPTRARAR
jgi:transglutaminase-like putative cysteine protease